MPRRISRSRRVATYASVLLLTAAGGVSSQAVSAATSPKTKVAVGPLYLVNGQRPVLTIVNGGRQAGTVNYKVLDDFGTLLKQGHPTIGAGKSIQTFMGRMNGDEEIVHAVVTIPATAERVVLWPASCSGRYTYRSGI